MEKKYQQEFIIIDSSIKNIFNFTYPISYEVIVAPKSQPTLYFKATPGGSEELPFDGQGETYVNLPHWGNSYLAYHLDQQVSQIRAKLHPIIAQTLDKSIDPSKLGWLDFTFHSEKYALNKFQSGKLPDVKQLLAKPIEKNGKIESKLTIRLELTTLDQEQLAEQIWTFKQHLSKEHLENIELELMFEDYFPRIHDFTLPLWKIDTKEQLSHQLSNPLKIARTEKKLRQNCFDILKNVFGSYIDSAYLSEDDVQITHLQYLGEKKSIPPSFIEALKKPILNKHGEVYQRLKVKIKPKEPITVDNYEQLAQLAWEYKTELSKHEIHVVELNVWYDSIQIPLWEMNNREEINKLISKRLNELRK